MEALILFCITFVLALLTLVGLLLRLSFLAQTAGVRVGILSLVAKRMSRIPPEKFLPAFVEASKAVLEVSLERLQVHYLASGNIGRFVDSMIAAQKENNPLTFEDAATLDLVLSAREVAERSANPS